MKRDVFLTAKAERQLHEAADWYAERNAHVADAWFKGIVMAIEQLATVAERFALARENDAMSFELRERRYGLGKQITHRVLYVIRPDKIVVHQIRHVAQRDITEDEN
jgi:plasmid stabilization system protein ParE